MKSILNPIMTFFPGWKLSGVGPSSISYRHTIWVFSQLCWNGSGYRASQPLKVIYYIALFFFFFDFSLSAGLGVPESDSYGSGRAGLGNSKIIQRKQLSLQFLTNQTVMREFHFLTDLISESMSGRSLVLLTHLRYILCRRGGQRK